MQFVSDAVLDRLKTGKFVARRRSAPAIQGAGSDDERRRLFSPLAITKRCVRYDPWVFSNRRETVIAMAQRLNMPGRQVLAISGEEGTGKTSTIRALIELMGSRNEQVLWFEAGPHSGFEDLISFLFRYLTEIAQVELPSQETAALLAMEDPFARLRVALEGMAHVPLVIVVDNLESMVDGFGRFTAPLLGEMVAFLSEFEHLRVVLAGEAIPHADLAELDEITVSHWRLSHFSGPELDGLLRDLSAEASAPVPDAQRLMIASEGDPWRVRLLLAWAKRLDEHNWPAGLAQLQQAMGSGAISSQQLGRWVWPLLSEPERNLAAVLSLLRHAMGWEGLTALFEANLKPVPSITSADGWLKSVSRKTFPPQAVLDHVKAGALNGKMTQFQPCLTLYTPIRATFEMLTEPESKLGWHGVLARFYETEKSRPMEKRRYPVQRVFLNRLSTYHMEAAESDGLPRLEAQIWQAAPPVLRKDAEPSVSQPAAPQAAVIPAQPAPAQPPAMAKEAPAPEKTEAQQALSGLIGGAAIQPDPAIEASIENLLAQARRAKNAKNRTEAQRLLRHALEKAEPGSTKWGEALLMLAHIEENAFQHNEALMHYGELVGKLGRVSAPDMHVQMAALAGLGRIAAFRGQWHEAGERYREALCVPTEMAERSIIAMEAARLGAENSQWLWARPFAELASGEQAPQAVRLEAMALLATILGGLGLEPEAEALLSQAMTFAEACHEPYARAGFVWDLAERYRSHNPTPERLKQALDLLQALEEQVSANLTPEARTTLRQEIESLQASLGAGA